MQWTPTPAPALRPMSLGEIIDGGFRVLRANIGSLVRITAIFVIPIQVLTVLVNLSTLPTRRTVVLFDGRRYTQLHYPTAALFGGFAVIVILGGAARLIAAGAITRVVSQWYLGGQPDASGSLQFALRRFWPLVGLTLLHTFGVVLGMVACFVPGIFLMVSWAVSTPALIIEGAGPAQSLGRSMKLVRGRWWPTLGYSIVIALLVAIPGIIVNVPVGILFGTGRVSTVVASGIGNGVISLVTTPFAAATVVLLYFDLRVRHEGFDITVMTRALDIAPPQGTTPATPTTWGTAPPPPPAWGTSPPPPPPPPPPVQ